MKQLIVMLMALGIGFGASAQTKTIKGNFRPQVRTAPAKSRVVVVAPRAYYGRSFYQPYYGFNYPLGYSPYWGWQNNVARVPSDLELTIDDIRSDYDYQIAETRHDKTLSKSERKSRIRQLKHEREQAIIDAKRNYYH